MLLSCKLLPPHTHLQYSVKVLGACCCMTKDVLGCVHNEPSVIQVNMHTHAQFERPTTCCRIVYPKCWTSIWCPLWTSCKATGTELRASPRFNCSKPGRCHCFASNSSRAPPVKQGVAHALCAALHPDDRMLICHSARPDPKPQQPAVAAPESPRIAGQQRRFGSRG